MAPRQRYSATHPSSATTTTTSSSSSTAIMNDEIGAASSDLIDTTKPIFSTKSSSSSSNCSSSSRLDLDIDIAKERHDLFNLVALLFVVAATLINWDFRQIVHGPTAAFHGDYFYLNWLTTQIYFIIDLIWVARVPTCVKSPDVIIKHHFVAIAYLSAPMAWPEYRWFMGACLSVEINTWFLILRRVLYKRKDRIPAALMEIVSISFYFSWIVIRVFIYPGIMYTFCQMAYDTVQATGILWHWPMMFIPIHFFLCLLNLKWTYDLFQPIFARMFAADQKSAPRISSGL